MMVRERTRSGTPLAVDRHMLAVWVLPRRVAGDQTWCAQCVVRSRLAYSCFF